MGGKTVDCVRVRAPAQRALPTPEPPPMPEPPPHDAADMNDVALNDLIPF